MAILIKARPQSLSEDPISFDTKLAAGTQLQAGDVAYIWFSETQGGKGLVGRGTVARCSASGRRSALTVTGFQPASQALGNAQIGGYRDVPGLEPQATLAKKLYFHAHNKTVSVSRVEAEFLDQHV